MKKQINFFIIIILILLISNTIVMAYDVEIGDYIGMGEYRGDALLWRCVGEDENGLLIISDKVICYKAYDAVGDHGEMDEHRKRGGSNLWSQSNIRCWLNSDSDEVVYICGNPPVAENVIKGKNAYDTEKGFLTNFSSEEKAAIKKVKLKTALTEWDKGLSDGKFNTYIYEENNINPTEIEADFQYTEDKIFIPDAVQIDMIKKNLTEDYVVKNEYALRLDDYADGKDKILLEGYMIRTVHMTTSSMINQLYMEDGVVRRYMCRWANESVGVRPAFYLSDDAVFTEGYGTLEKPYTIKNQDKNVKSEDENLKFILPIEYDDVEIDNYCDVIIAADKQGKEAIYNYDGEKISEDFDDIEKFNGNITIAKQGSRKYFLSCNGEIGMEVPENMFYYEPREGLVFVDLSDNPEETEPYYYQGEFAVLDYKGNQLSVLEYNKFMPSKTLKYDMTFSAGRMVFQGENKKYGAIDLSFNTVIEPEYDRLYPFSAFSGCAVAMKNGKYGIINKNGEAITDFIYDYIEPVFENAIFYGYTDHEYKEHKVAGYKTKLNEKFWLLSSDGKTILEPLYELQAERVFKEYSRILVKTNKTGSEPVLYGIMDFDGNIIVPAENERIDDITDGFIAVRKAERQCGYYDINGNKLNELNYNSVLPFSEGMGVVRRYGENDEIIHEVINTKGEVLFNTPSFVLNGFHHGVTYYADYTSMEHEKYIDNTGELIEPQWWCIRNSEPTWEKEICEVSDGKYSGVIKHNSGKEVIKVVSENNELSIFANEKKIDFTDAFPFIDENGRTQIPIRAVGEALGCNVEWNETERKVTLTKGETVVTITIDSKEMAVDEKTIEMDTTAKIIGERTYIPLRFAGEALGFEVEWVVK